MKKKKLSSRERAINRVQRRLKTLNKKGIETKIVPTKKNIEEIFKENNIRVTKKNINKVVEDTYNAATYHFRNVKGARKALKVKTAQEARELSGSEIHNILQSYNSGDEEIDIIKEAYGY